MSSVAAEPTVIHVYTDGSAKPNPGRGGYGYALLVDGTLVEGRGVYLGDTPTLVTNNVAEWRALVDGMRAGIELARRRYDDARVVVRLDSELAVKQLRGVYRCNDTKLMPYYSEARRLYASHRVHVEHVLRARNSLANDLAQEAVDRRRDVRLAVTIVDDEQALPSKKRIRTADNNGDPPSV